MTKKIVSLVLVITLVIAGVPAVFAANFSDTSSNWAAEAIDKWNDYGVVNGYNGEFMPSKEMSRAEAAQIMVNLFKLEAEADLKNYTDADGWYKSALAKCVAAGIMQGYNGKLYPEELVTREQYFVMIARALHIPESDTCNEEFSDADKIGNWAKGYIYALVNLGIVNGYNGKIFAGETITRDQAVTVIDKAIVAYANEDGKTVKAEKKGIILVVADNVTVEAPEGSVIVVAKKGADVSLKGTDKKVEVIVIADDVELTNVPAGSVVTTEEGITGTTANGRAVAENSSKTIGADYVAPSSYTVNFNLNGHGDDIASQTVEPGSLIERPADPTDEEYGYTFEGWYKDSKLTTAWNFDNDKVNYNVTLYAKWSYDGIIYPDYKWDYDNAVVRAYNDSNFKTAGVSDITSMVDNLAGALSDYPSLSRVTETGKYKDTFASLQKLGLVDAESNPMTRANAAVFFTADQLSKLDAAEVVTALGNDGLDDYLTKCGITDDDAIFLGTALRYGVATGYVYSEYATSDEKTNFTGSTPNSRSAAMTLINNATGGNGYIAYLGGDGTNPGAAEDVNAFLRILKVFSANKAAFASVSVENLFSKDEVKAVMNKILADEKLISDYEWKYDNSVILAYNDSNFKTAGVSDITSMVDNLAGALSDYPQIIRVTQTGLFNATRVKLGIAAGANNVTMANASVFHVADQLSKLNAAEVVTALGNDGLDDYLAECDITGDDAIFLGTALRYGVATGYVYSKYATSDEKTNFTGSTPNSRSAAMTLINNATGGNGYIAYLGGDGTNPGAAEDVNAFLSILKVLSNNYDGFASVSGNNLFSSDTVKAKINTVLSSVGE